MYKMNKIKILLAAGLTIALSLRAEQTDTLVSVQLHDVEVVSTLKENGPMRQQPSAVSLVDKTQMENRHIASLKSASELVPNMFVPDYGSRLTSAIYIRGIGSRINTPAVGLYVDNIPFVDKSAFDFRLYDVERIDVLRGPQGTLYGRNTMGGVVRVNTKNPFSYSGTDLKLGFATGDWHRDIALTHYHRVSDELAFAAGGYYEGGSGFFEHSLTGKNVDAMQAGGGRIRAIWRPTANWKTDFLLSYDYSDEGAYPYYYTGTLSGAEQYPDLVGKLSANRESNYRRGMLNAGLNLEYLADGWQMNAVTAYQNLSDRMFMDQDFMAPDIYTLEQKQRINTISEELTLKSHSSGIWNWLTGLNIQYQTLHTEGPVNFHSDGVEWLEKTIDGYMPDLSQRGMKMGVELLNDPIGMGGIFETPSFDAALFHQSTVELAERLSLVAGLRLDYSHQQMDYEAPAYIDYNFAMTSPMMPINLTGLNAASFYTGTLKDDYLKVLPRLAIKYDLGKGSNLYASISRGMRSGGYNVQMFSDLLQGSTRNAMMQQIQDGTKSYLSQLAQRGMPQQVIGMIGGYLDQMPITENPDVRTTTRFRPEYSWNYEVGGHLNLLDNHLLADAALFCNEVFDQQIARFANSGLGRMMVNAGKCRSVGGELSLLWRPDRHLSMHGNYGYTHATFVEYDDGSGMEYTGNYVPFVPMHTFSTEVVWSPWNNGLSFALNGNGAGRIYWTEGNDARQPFYALLGAHAAYETSRYTIVLWGKNLTDTKFNTFYFQSAERGFEQHGKPLQVGVDLRLHI